MRGVYQGIDCFTDDYRIDGVWQKALIYQVKPEGDDEKALTAAGFVDMENDLWVKVVTTEQYRSIVEDFEKQDQTAAQQQLKKSHEDNEANLLANARLHAHNEYMASCRVKMRSLGISFVGASIFSEVMCVVLLYTSIIYRSDADMKTVALPMWASLTFLPVIMVGSLAAAIKKLPEIYIVLSGLLVAAAFIAWDHASIALGVMAAAFAVFYILTRPINLLKTDPAYPAFSDKTSDEFNK